MNLTNENVLFMLMGGAFTIIIILMLRLKKKSKNSHKWRKKSAKKTLKKLSMFQNNGQMFMYLRSIDPFVFEEMILYALSLRDDVEIIEATRYTGDGGIDGTFIWKTGNYKKKVLIQAKRYRNHINKKHIDDFCVVLANEGADMGMFVHTGRTGKGSKEILKNCHKMRLYSGEKMLSLLFNSKL